MVWRWTAKLKETAPNLKKAHSGNPRSILAKIITMSEAKAFNTVISSASHFCYFRPDDNMALSSYIKEYQKRYQNLKENFPITSEVKTHIKYLLHSHVHNLHSELVNLCHDCSYEQLLSS